MFKDGSLIAAVVLFWIHGACYFRIRYLLKKSGMQMGAMTDVGDMVAQYKRYVRDAPQRGWSRPLVYVSVLSLVLSVAALFGWVVRQPPGWHYPRNASRLGGSR